MGRKYIRVHITTSTTFVLSQSVISPFVRRESRGRLLISTKGIADWIKLTLPRQAGFFSGITSAVFFVPVFLRFLSSARPSGNVTEYHLDVSRLNV